jgi:hypothetical protein
MLRNPGGGRLDGGREEGVWKIEEKETGNKEMKRMGHELASDGAEEGLKNVHTIA